MSLEYALSGLLWIREELYRPGEVWSGLGSQNGFPMEKTSYLTVGNPILCYLPGQGLQDLQQVIYLDHLHLLTG